MVTNMVKLNLPPYEIKLRNEGGKTEIWDMLRQKFVALTPEEWVRQHFVHYLVEHKGYQLNLMANEVSLSLNGTQRRCDTVLYDQHVHPRMIIEYKRPTVVITQKVFDQISRYNLAMRVEYLVVSNGLAHYCCKMDYAQQTYTFLKEIPSYFEL